MPVTYAGANIRADLPGLANQYLLLVDLDNAGGAGPYKHIVTAGQGVTIVSLAGALRKQNILDQWEAVLATVLSVGVASSDLALVCLGRIGMADALTSEKEIALALPVDLSVSGGDLVAIAAPVMVEAGLTSASAVPDVSGTPRAISPGDVLINVRPSGSPLAGTTINYFVRYYVGF